MPGQLFNEMTLRGAGVGLHHHLGGNVGHNRVAPREREDDHFSWRLIAAGGAFRQFQSRTMSAGFLELLRGVLMRLAGDPAHSPPVRQFAPQKVQTTVDNLGRRKSRLLPPPPPGHGTGITQKLARFRLSNPVELAGEPLGR